MAFKERKIVDVRDLFGQDKSPVGSPETSPSPQMSPGGPFAKSGWGNGALGEYKPKVCSSSGNGEVFFGGPGPPESTREKREANKAPVMIDMDVGIEEQLGHNINSSTTKYGAGLHSDVRGEDPSPPPSPKAPSSAPTSTNTQWSFGPRVADSTPGRLPNRNSTNSRDRIDGGTGNTSVLLNTTTTSRTTGLPTSSRGVVNTNSSTGGVTLGSETRPTTNTNTQSPTATTANMNGTRSNGAQHNDGAMVSNINIKNKYAGRPLPPPPGVGGGPPSPPPPPPPPPPAPSSSTAANNGAGHRASSAPKDVTVSQMNGNFSLGPPMKTTGSNQQIHGGGLGGGNRGRGPGPGGGGSVTRDSAGSQGSSSLDQSSSGFETDDNSSTPNSTIQSARNNQSARNTSSSSQEDNNRRRPPHPPPAPPSGGRNSQDVTSTSTSTSKDVGRKSSQNTDSSYQSEDGSDFEDEATLIFDDEDDDTNTVEGNRKQVFVEYHGDDYGQFLNDDADDKPVVDQNAAPPRSKKRQRRRKKEADDGSGGGGTPGSTVSSGTDTVKNKKRTLKGRLAAVFMGNNNSGNGNKPEAHMRPRIETGSSIHSFSFADSKIGNYLHGGGSGGGSVSGNADSSSSPYGTMSSRSGSELAPCDSAYGGDRKWWNTDTLSARSLAGNSDVMLKSRRAPSGNDNIQYGQMPQNSNNPDPAINGSGFGDDLIDGLDFESHRKSVIYGIPTERKAQHKGSIFRRFKKDNNKPMMNSLPDNTVSNPLADMIPNDTKF